MPVGSQHVLPAIEVVVEEEETESQERQAGLVQTCGVRFIPEPRVPVVFEEGESLSVKVADEQPETPLVVPVCGIDPHAGLSPGAFSKGHAGLHPTFQKTLAALV